MPGKSRPAAEERRLAAFLADAGIASRRRAEELIRSGKVTVGRTPVLDPARKVLPGRDRVAVDGSPVRPAAERLYVLLHKPPGCLSASSDPGGKKTVLDLLPPSSRRLYPVGRLDFNAEGLLLLTDDGRIAYRLTHPRFQVPRTYLVKVRGFPPRPALASLVRGVRDGTDLLRAKSVRAVRRTKSNSWLEVVLTEGKWREVRRLFDHVGHPVVRLIRTAFGPLRLGRLLPGQYRALTAGERRRLLDFLGHDG